MSSLAIDPTVPSADLASGVPVDRRRLVGTTLKGTYRVVRLIAEGGMGAVYEAEHIRLGRKVALKIMLSGLASDEQAVARFRREAELVARLGHPQIVQVFDADETEAGDLYLVMEYLEGETLAERLERQKRLPVASALRIVSRLASALAAVHEHGIVHRDLKPANVFLAHIPGEEDFVKLLDFGISTMTAGRRITLDHALLGTPEYMAPEQITSASTVDSATDQFGLAVMTYEMLTGTLPFDGQRPDDILEAVLHSKPAPVSSVAPWVGSALDAVVARGLSKEPAQRFPSISQYAWALANAARSAGVASSPSWQPQRAGRYSVLPAGSERALDRVPASGPRRSTTPPSLRSPARHVEHAARLLADARAARESGELDDAVFAAEKLLEVATDSPCDAMYGLLRTAIPVLDEIFATRVGPAEHRLFLGPVDPRRLNLTPRAAALRSLAEGGATVGSILAESGMPRRDALRLLAGLLRRGALSG